MIHHTEAYRSPERTRARSEAHRKSQQRRRAREAEVVAGVQQLLDAGFVTATYKKGTKLSARNLVSVTLTDEGKQALRSIRAGEQAIRTVNEGLKKGWYEWAAPQEAAETSEVSRIEIWRPVVGYEGLYEVSTSATCDLWTESHQ